jgi:hydroxymethylpyrimidine/phosphomethylpyrimidine kinase
VGETLHAEYLAAGAHDGHPYADWLRTYADEDFAAATLRAIEIADGAGRAASAGERKAMITAFRHSCRYEVEFFDAPSRHS